MAPKNQGVAGRGRRWRGEGGCRTYVRMIANFISPGESIKILKIDHVFSGRGHPTQFAQGQVRPGSSSLLAHKQCSFVHRVLRPREAAHVQLREHVELRVNMEALPTPTHLPAPQAQVQAAESETQTLLDHKGERGQRTRRSRQETPYCDLSSVERWIWGTLCLLGAISVPFLVAVLCHEAGYKAYAVAAAFAISTIGVIGYLVSPLAPADPKPSANDEEALKDTGVFSDSENLFLAVRDTAGERFSCREWRRKCAELCDPMMPYLKSALAISIQLAAGWAAVKQLKALHKAVCIIDQLRHPQSLLPQRIPCRLILQSFCTTGSHPAASCSFADELLHARPAIGYGHLDAGRSPTVRLVHQVRVKGLPNISLLHAAP